MRTGAGKPGSADVGKCIRLVKVLASVLCRLSVIEPCCPCAFAQALGAQGTGLIVSERLINCPPKLAPPLLQFVLDEIGWAAGDDEASQARAHFCAHRPHQQRCKRAARARASAAAGALGARRCGHTSPLHAHPTLRCMVTRPQQPPRAALTARPQDVREAFAFQRYLLLTRVYSDPLDEGPEAPSSGPGPSSGVRQKLKVQLGRTGNRRRGQACI